ncbi:hypothetical protein B296_00037407 [Ensete ventricosum]|uniref:Retrotransposon gag domain-containing protein n=1 Tax=Ensete ventricosum TaxID=4639 RepID=A0A426XT98_ENSVE|nr:hypothetical protein B296_00037407 [Ensete ventricosum]
MAVGGGLRALPPVCAWLTFTITIPETAQGISRPSSASRTSREHQSTQKVSTPTDVGRLTHSDENRSSRHLSSTPESFVTFLALGGPMLFNNPGLAPPDPGLSPITPGLGPPVVTTKAFLSLTQQVQTLTGMIQVIVPYIPQLAQAPTHQHPHVPRQTVQQEAPQSRWSQGEHLGKTPHPPVEATIENPNASVSQSLNRSRDVMRLPPEPDIISSDSTNSVREQLRQVNQRLDEVQRDFIRSKEEVGETNKGGSPFALEILDKPIPPVSDYRLWSPTTGALTRQSTSQLRQGVRAQLHSKFLPKADGRLTARPHARKRRATRPIRQQILGGGPEDARHSPYYGNPRITHGTSVLTVLLIVDRETPVHSARDVATGEPVCSRRVISGREAGSRKITRNPDVTSLKDNLSGHPEENTGRSYQPLGLSRSRSIQPELRRYCRFHRDYGHDTEECNDLRNQIEDLIRQGHLHRFVRDRRASEERPRRDRNPSPRPDRPIEKQIDVIIDRPASGGNSSSTRKAYARNAVEKRPRRSQDPGITFGEGDDAYPDHDDALKLGLTDKDFLPVVTTLTGFTGFPQLEQPSSQSPSGKSQD